MNSIKKKFVEKVFELLFNNLKNVNDPVLVLKTVVKTFSVDIVGCLIYKLKRIRFLI